MSTYLKEMRELATEMSWERVCQAEGTSAKAQASAAGAGCEKSRKVEVKQSREPVTSICFRTLLCL